MIDNNGCCFFDVSMERIACTVGVEVIKEIVTIANIRIRIE